MIAFFDNQLTGSPSSKIFSCTWIVLPGVESLPSQGRPERAFLSLKKTGFYHILPSLTRYQGFYIITDHLCTQDLYSCSTLHLYPFCESVGRWEIPGLPARTVLTRKTVARNWSPQNFWWVWFDCENSRREYADAASIQNIGYSGDNVSRSVMKKELLWLSRGSSCWFRSIVISSKISHCGGLCSIMMDLFR